MNVRRRVTLSTVAAVLGSALAAALQTANAVNPTTAYGTWSCSYDETSGFNQGYVIMSTSGACAEQYYTSGWYWNSGTGTYVPWGPEDWVNGPGGAWQKVQLTTRQYAYGQIRDTSYMGGTDSPTIEAFAD